MPLKQPETDRLYTRDEYRNWAAAQPRGRYERQARRYRHRNNIHF